MHCGCQSQLRCRMTWPSCSTTRWHTTARAPSTTDTLPRWAALIHTIATPHYHPRQFQNFFSRKAEELLLVRLREHNYCCGKRRLLSGTSYRCRAATCFIQASPIRTPLLASRFRQYGSFYWQYTLQDGKDKEEYCFCQVAVYRRPAQHHPARRSTTPSWSRTLLFQGISTAPAATSSSRRTSSCGAQCKSRNASRRDCPRSMRHNTPLVQENYVKCRLCGRVDHEICVMYNAYLGLQVSFAARDADAAAGQPYECSNCSTAPPVRYDPRG